MVDHSSHQDESLLVKMEEEVEAESGGIIFGAFDGVTAVLGVLVSLLNQSPHILVRACVGLSIASAIGMGFGQYTGDSERKISSAVAIGLATAAGTMLPVVPFLFLSKSLAIVVATGLVVLLGVAIGWQRSKEQPKKIAYGQTFALLLLATGVNVAVAVIFPGGGA